MGADLDTVCAEIYPLYIQHITSLVEYLVGQGVLQLSQLTPDALSALSGKQPLYSSCCCISELTRHFISATTLHQVCCCSAQLCSREAQSAFQTRRQKSRLLIVMH